MLINYEKLFEPYTGDGHTLENTIKYLKSEAAKHKIDTEIMELAMNEIFTEIAGGRMFNKTKCSCGCGIDKGATDLIHAIRDRMFAINKTVLAQTKQILNQRYDTAILGHIHRVNQDYINSQMPYRPWKENLLSRYYKFMNPKNSEILKGMKSLQNWINRKLDGADGP